MTKSDQTTSGDRTTEFIRLFTTHEPRLHGYVLSLAPNWESAEEILQSTNAILWEKFDHFEAGTNFFAWACKTARIEVMAFYRRQNREKLRFGSELIEMIADESETMDSLLAERQRYLTGCLERLRPRDRALIQQRYQRGATVPSIAKQTGRSVAAIYKALQRVRAMLMTCIETSLAEEKK